MQDSLRLHATRSLRRAWNSCMMHAVHDTIAGALVAQMMYPKQSKHQSIQPRCYCRNQLQK